MQTWNTSSPMTTKVLLHVDPLAEVRQADRPIQEAFEWYMVWERSCQRVASLTGIPIQTRLVSYAEDPERLWAEQGLLADLLTALAHAPIEFDPSYGWRLSCKNP